MDIEFNNSDGYFRWARTTGKFRDITSPDSLKELRHKLTPKVSPDDQIEFIVRVISNAPPLQTADAAKARVRTKGARSRRAGGSRSSLLRATINGSAITPGRLTYRQLWHEMVEGFLHQKKAKKGQEAIIALRKLKAPGIRLLGAQKEKDYHLENFDVYIYGLSSAQILRGMMVLCSALQITAEIEVKAQNEKPKKIVFGKAKSAKYSHASS